MPHFDIDIKAFSQNLKKLRVENKLTQKQMADKLGVSERSYIRYEVAKHHPSYKTTLALIQNFDMEAYNKLTGLPDDFFETSEQGQ